MKRSFKRMLSMGLLAALLLSVFSFGGVFAAGDAADTVRAGRLTGKNWMSGIPDDRYLYEINLPGTHDCVTAYCKNTTDNAVKLFGRSVYDSGEYAKTQSLTLSEQLNAGVRYLDLRFSAKQGKLLLCHGNNERIAVINKIMQGLDAFNPSRALLHRESPPFLELDTEFYAYKDAGCTVPFTGKRVFSLLQKRKRRYKGIFKAFQKTNRALENRDQSRNAAAVSVYRKRKRPLHKNARAFAGAGKNHSHDAFL